MSTSGWACLIEKNIAPTKELSTETLEKIIKLIPKKIRLIYVKEKQSWRVGNKMKVIFNQKLLLWQGQMILKLLLWGRSNEIYIIMTVRKKISKFPKSFMVYSYMSFKGHEEAAITTSTIREHVYIEIIEKCLVL